MLFAVPPGVLIVAECLLLFVNRRHRKRLPLLAAGVYLATILLFYVLARASDDPLGYAWVPVIELAVPWYFLKSVTFGQSLLLPMIVSAAVNCALIYVAAKLLVAMNYPDDSIKT
jgi:hypothetical protein